MQAEASGGGSTTLYHGSQNFRGTQFDLSVATDLQRAGTPQPGIYLTDDFLRAAQGYGRDGVMVRVRVPTSFADRIRQLGGPRGNAPEYFVNTEEGVQILNQDLTVTPTREAIIRFFSGDGF